MKISVYNRSGEVLRQIEISEAVFGQPLNEALVHQALVAQQANARQGTSDSKTRAEVIGSTKKLYRQKHTGRARAGSAKSGLRRGGGAIFGPHPRDYSQSLPKKMRRQAIRCVLSGKVADEAMVILDELDFEAPRTRDMAAMLKALGVEKRAILALTAGQETATLSARNLPLIKTIPAVQLNVADMLSCDKLLMSELALREIETLWGGTAHEGA
ncbi:MAG: 50S ribosomal protein L4 [Dehalococcoidia bacterium]|nr:50S ribosomal protein L4 [Dehalococcoidia bacterium]